MIWWGQHQDWRRCCHYLEYRVLCPELIFQSRINFFSVLGSVRTRSDVLLLRFVEFLSCYQVNFVHSRDAIVKNRWMKENWQLRSVCFGRWWLWQCWRCGGISLGRLTETFQLFLLFGIQFFDLWFCEISAKALLLYLQRFEIVLPFFNKTKRK